MTLPGQEGCSAALPLMTCLSDCDTTGCYDLACPSLSQYGHVRVDVCDKFRLR